MSVRLIIFMGISLLIGLGAGCGTSESRLALNSDLTGGAKTIVAPRIGAQLWSVRDALKEDFDGTLTALSLQGFEGVEFAGYFGKYAERPADLKRFLASIGLTTSGAHVPFEQLDQQFQQTVTFYQALGVRTLIIPWDVRAFADDGVAAFASDLNRLSQKLTPLGMQIGFHNHAQEWANFGNKSFFEYIAENTVAEVVLQQDVGWTMNAGGDPIAFVKSYPGRILTTHFKSPLRENNERLPIIGLDDVPWLALYHATVSDGGAEWIVIEQEEYPQGMSSIESLAKSKGGLDAILAD